MPWRWPYERRRRGGYTELLLDHAYTVATEGGTGRLACVETAAGLVGRVIALAEPEGASGAILAGLGPATRYRIGRDLLRTGESLHAIRTAGGRLRLIPAEGAHTVHGGPDPATWRYTFTLAGPSSTVTVRDGVAASVVHVRFPGPSSRPWEGVSPVQTVERGLLQTVERMLTRRFGDPVAAARLLELPRDGASPEKWQKIRDKIRDRGATAAVRSGAATETPGASGWTLTDLRPTLDPATAGVLEPLGRAVLRAAGVPDGLFGADSAGAAREAARQFYRATVLPLSEIILEELREKLDSPGLRFTFRRLAAADVAGMSRAFVALVDKGGLSPSDAASVTGVDLPEGAEARSVAADLDRALAGVLARTGDVDW